MSFDIFLQAFAGGQAAAGHPDGAFRALEPYLDGNPAGGFARLATPDGDADVFGIGSTGLMINHASGEFIWQLLIDVAVAGDYAIMPVGRPVCLVREDMKDDLPEEMRADAVVVRSGTEVMKLVINDLPEQVAGRPGAPRPARSRWRRPGATAIRSIPG